MDKESMISHAVQIASEAAQKVVKEVSEGRDAPLTEQERGLVRMGAFETIYERVLRRLHRSVPIVDIFEQNGLLPFIGPLTQRGYEVIVREDQSEFVAPLEELAGKSLDTGTIIHPCGFGHHADRRIAVIGYRNALSNHNIPSKIITIQYPGTEEDAVVLYVPLFRT